MHRITFGGSDVPVELRPIDLDEDWLVEEFMESGCGCKMTDGGPCSKLFDISYIKQTRLSFREMTSLELDMVIIGQLIALSNTSSTTDPTNRNTSHTRQKAYTVHYYQGKQICRRMFLFLHSIGKKRLNNITAHFQKNGIAPRVHGNTRRLPVHTLTL